MFDVVRFQSLRKSKFGSPLYFFDELDSTNSFAEDLARKHAEEGTVVLAESQTHGIGRNNHAWYSPAKTNLYFTLILYPPAVRLHYLPYLVGLSIAEVLELWNLSCDLKWPNDVLVDGKKVAGVLIQTSVEENRVQFALLGIGINLNQKAFPPDLQRQAISMAQCIGEDVDRESFLATLLSKLEQYYERMPTMLWQELTELMTYRSSFLKGCDVQIDHNGRLTTGTTGGLDSLGGLIVNTATGREIFYAGEIQSCRKK